MVDEGRIRVAAWLDGKLVADAMTESRGPWDLATVVAEADVAPFVASLDRVTVSVGSAYAPTTAGQVLQELLERVPDEFRDQCTPARPSGASGVIAGVVCSPAGALESAEYTRFDDPDALEAAFRALADGSLVPLTGTDCSAGASEVSWSIEGESAGRMACFPDAASGGALVIAWTDVGHDILGVGRSSTATYAELYDWWLGAGVTP
jgi:hypothetical protein